MKSKKILLISSEFPPDVGGIGNHAFNLALHLSKENYKVTVVADVLNVDEKVLNDLKKNLRFNFISIQRKKIAALTYFSRIFKAITQAKKNDIIICSGKFSLWTGNVLKRTFPAKKYIAIVHGSELDLKNKRAKNFTNASLKKFDKIVAVSNYTKNFLPEKLLKDVVIKVIPNGIDMDEFISFKEKDHADNSSSKELSIITIGSVSERKGQQNVIRALPEMLKIFPNIIYHIIGKPVIQKQLTVLATSLNVEDKIIFHGMIAREELLQLLYHSKIKIMLSNHTSEGDFEGFGIAILEANALGKPAIGAASGGISDAIDNYKTGILVDAKDDKAIANALKEIMNNYETYSANALQWAQKHDWKIIVKKYLKIIED